MTCSPMKKPLRRRSRVQRGSGGATLLEAIRSSPERELGEKVVRRFGAELPFLLRYGDTELSDAQRKLSDEMVKVQQSTKGQRPAV